MNINTVKTIVGIAAQIGASAVTSAIIQNNMPAHKNLIQQISVPVAGLAFGGMAANSCKNYTDDMCDQIAALGSSIKSMKTPKN